MIRTREVEGGHPSHREPITYLGHVLVYLPAFTGNSRCSLCSKPILSYGQGIANPATGMAVHIECLKERAA